MGNLSQRQARALEIVRGLLQELNQLGSEYYAVSSSRGRYEREALGGYPGTALLHQKMLSFQERACGKLGEVSFRSSQKFHEHKFSRTSVDLRATIKRKIVAWKAIFENMILEITNHPEEFFMQEQSAISSQGIEGDSASEASAENKDRVRPTERQLDALRVVVGLLNEVSSLSSLAGAEGFRRFYGRAVKRLSAISSDESSHFGEMRVPKNIVGNPSEPMRKRLEDLKFDWLSFFSHLASELSEHPEDVFEGRGDSVSSGVAGGPSLYDLHPSVAKAVDHLWKDGHYRQAILDTYIALINAVKEKSRRLDLDNTPLTQTVFSANNPILKVSDDEDEQKGFMWLFSGAVMGIRNPKAHRLVPQEDPQRAFEWLSFASVLFRVLDECEVVERRTENARHSERGAAE